jgi:hypothetical protein
MSGQSDDLAPSGSGAGPDAAGQKAAVIGRRKGDDGLALALAAGSTLQEAANFAGVSN